MRKPTRKSLVRTLDKAFGDFIKLRDEKCVTCGATEHLQCGHLFSRVAYSTRWDDRNAFCQCRSCNMRHEYDPGPLTMHFLKEYSDMAYSCLHRLHHTTVKYTDADLERFIELYRNKRANLELEKAMEWR